MNQTQKMRKILTITKDKRRFPNGPINHAMSYGEFGRGASSFGKK